MPHHQAEIATYTNNLFTNATYDDESDDDIAESSGDIMRAEPPRRFEPKSAFASASSLYVPLSARGTGAELPSRPPSRLGTPRSLAELTWQDGFDNRASNTQPTRPASPQTRPMSAAAAARQLPPRPSSQLSGELPPRQLSSQHSGELPPHQMSSQLSGQHPSQVPRPALPPLRLPRRPSGQLSGALSPRQMSSQLSAQLSRLPSNPLLRRSSGASSINADRRSEYGDISAYSSGASTPDGSRPVTPRERVQHQILLNQQKRMQRLQAAAAAAMAGQPVQPVDSRPGTPRARPSVGLAAVRGGSAAASPDVSRPTTPRLQPQTSKPSEASLIARGLALVYDPTLEDDSKPRCPKPDPALLLAASPFNADMSDMRAFLGQPGPSTGAMQCFIVRHRSGNGGSRLYPRYSLFLDVGHKFLAAARKRKKSKASMYVMSLDEKDLLRGSSNMCGKVRSNFVGTEFSVFDAGMRAAVGSKGDQCEVAAVRYETNILGTKGPRRMTAVIPEVVSENGRAALSNQALKTAPASSKSLLDRQKKGSSGVVVLQNKAPRWNEALNAYCLNFKGRVTQASVKNFQLAAADDLETVLLQFGKVGKDMFTLDYRWPLSAVQAFGIALSSFDNKLACE
ncbi:probable protein king tubby at C-terminar half [Coccomyxa sp. Obi]|nr:probable protein king tubby at C-terminar half [Coccomyxa sp. Obi]